MSADLEKASEIINLLAQFAVDQINTVGFEPSNNATLVINLRAESGYTAKATYRNVNALKYGLIVSILESEIGQKQQSSNKKATS